MGIFSHRPPMIEPPFEQKDSEADAGDGAPEFHIRALDGGGGDFGVFAELKLVSRFYVAFLLVQQVRAEPGAVGSDAQTVDALLRGIAKNEFAGIGVDRDSLHGATWQSHLRFLLGPRQPEAECIPGLDEKLLALGVGWVKPIRGILNEHRKREAVGPQALKRVETDPYNALPSDFARDDKRSLRGID